MSVINKMLRDLDSRQAPGTAPSDLLAPRMDMARGTLIMDDTGSARRRRGSVRRAVMVVAVSSFMACVAVAWWLLNQNPLAQRTPAQLGVVLTTPPQASPAAVPRANSPVTAESAMAVVTVEPPLVAKAEPLGTKVTDRAQELAAGKSAVIEKSSATLPVPDTALKVDSTFKWTQGAGTASQVAAPATPRLVPGVASNVSAIPPASSALVGITEAPPQTPRVSPALEALAQAQSLWNAGSHAAAIDLLSEALAVTERASLAGAPAGSHAVQASLARELARMELADGRVSQALEMLTRLEPALTEFADIWAIRGNAAQRLGRHRESVSAYLMALKLRPGEPRWMLGAAVSLAAQGQTDAAAEWAEKARDGGVLSAEVAIYLRQLGVPMRER